MRIGFDVSAAQRRHGGISEYARRMLEAFIRLDSPHEFALFSTHDLRSGTVESLPDLPANFTLYPLRFPGRILKHSWRYLGWPRATSVLPPVDVFFAPHFLVPPGPFPRLVVTIHDLLFETHPEWFSPDDVKRFSSAARSAVGRADALVSDSDSTTQQLIEHLKVPANRVTTIPLGVNIYHTSSADWERAQRTLKLPNDYLLMLGTIEDRKNVAGVLAAYHQLLDHRPLPPLVLAGKVGQIDAAVLNQIHQPPFDGRVMLTGQFDDKDRPALLSHAKALLFPSLGEGFGLPVLEGFAAGVPVLTSTVTSLPEVAGEAALLVNPTDATAIASGIKQLLDDNQLRTRLIHMGRERAAQFTWDRCARQTLDVITQTGSLTKS